MPKWFETREAVDVGTTLARKLLQESGSSGAQQGKAADPERTVRQFLRAVDGDTQNLRLNVLQRARLAHAFKWHLRESGTDGAAADGYTKLLVTRLSAGGGAAAPAPGRPAAAAPERFDAGAVRAQGLEHLKRAAYPEAARCFRRLCDHDPGDAEAHNQLGAALLNLGEYAEAEAQLRRAIKGRESLADAHSNLGYALRAQGRVGEAEGALRRALKHKPGHAGAQVNLAATLLLTGRWAEAQELIERVLRAAPRNVEALTLRAQIARGEGRLAEAEADFRRACELAPQAASAWAGLAGLRRMTRADGDWLKRAEALVAAGIAPLDEADLRYAMGKFCDDTGDYARAFRHFRRANELQKAAAPRYDRDGQARLVNDLKARYGAAPLGDPAEGASDSELPVLVVGMPRSGTSLVEQIIASHPQARGAGELGFWSEAMQRLEGPVRAGTLDAAQRRTLAADYLRTLASQAPDALRVVDKATFNAQYLGPIHTVLPRARFIYLSRDPVDTCLSCYFTHLPPAMAFSMDLADLAHYYRQHHRIVEHWRSVLPPGTLLDVPYAGLVADPEGWSRRIVEFLGLPWDPQVLEFQKTARTVMTSSFWQVRQPVYRTSVGRWHHYRKFIGPLQGLSDGRA
ncbi:MAG: sulfotransferase [Proteobacteria bacterium]|nr:sulfotransferase [Pseudomonadota bacterium]